MASQSQTADDAQFEPVWYDHFFGAYVECWPDGSVEVEPHSVFTADDADCWFSNRLELSDVDKNVSTSGFTFDYADVVGASDE